MPKLSHPCAVSLPAHKSGIVYPHSADTCVNVPIEFSGNSLQEDKLKKTLPLCFQR